MKAAVYYGPEDIRTTDIPDAAIKADHEMLVKVTATSICGSDLHLYRGALDPIMERGRSQTGHELLGEVLQVGKSMGRFKKGDRVSMAYSYSCGHCNMCEVGQTAHCETTQKDVYGFGVPFGNLNGTHAEAMVLPHADAHTIHVPRSISDAAGLTLSCNLPSAVIANKLADIQPGGTSAVSPGSRPPRSPCRNCGHRTPPPRAPRSPRWHGGGYRRLHRRQLQSESGRCVPARHQPAHERLRQRAAQHVEGLRLLEQGVVDADQYFSHTGP